MVLIRSPRRGQDTAMEDRPPGLGGGADAHGGELQREGMSLSTSSSSSLSTYTTTATTPSSYRGKAGSFLNEGEEGRKEGEAEAEAGEENTSSGSEDSLNEGEVEAELEDLDSDSPQDSFNSGEGSDRAPSIFSDIDFGEPPLLSVDSSSSLTYALSKETSVCSTSSLVSVSLGGPSDWIKCFAIVDFDITYGQKVRATVPESALSQEEDNGIRMLAMPECQSDQTGDSFYCFRRRISTQLPLYSGSVLDHEYQYCYVLFRQCKSETEKRGYFQQSLVLVSKYPLYSLYRHILIKVGVIFFSRGPAILESVYSLMQTWPSHSCDTDLELPFLGEVIRFHAPHGKNFTGHWASNGCDRSHTSCDTFVVEKAGCEPLDLHAHQPPAPSTLPSPLPTATTGDAGLFQNIGLYRTFRPILPLLWPLWEKVLIGEPIMIIAPEASTASSMALGLVSLIAPIFYTGDYRPYFSTYEEDYLRILACHDSSQGLSLPATILGVTNPIFAKSFKYWPTIVQAPPKQASCPPPPPPRGAGPGLEDSSPSHRAKRRPFPPLKVISSSTEVEAGLANGKSNEGVPVGVLTRKEPIMKPNIMVLAHLHRLNGLNRKEIKANRKSVSEVKNMNDNLLRRHFQGLTQTFLSPFEKYFELRLGQQEESPVESSNIFRLVSRSKPLKSCRIGLYDDPEKFLTPFDEESFLSGLKKSGGVPAEFKDLNWVSLYRRFIRSPNFRPWFNSRRAACVAQLRGVCRATVRTVTGESFLRSAIEDGNGYLSESEMIQLMLRVHRALDQEMQSSSPEEELCVQMRNHLEAVERALSPVVVQAARDMYGLTSK